MKNDSTIASDPKKIRQIGSGLFTGFDFDFPPAILHVKILSGSDLYKTDCLHEIDPYVEVALGSDSSRSITLLRGGSDCTFDWTVAFPFHPGRAEKEHPDGLVITVWDQDLGSKDDEVGLCILPIKSIIACETEKCAFRGEAKLLHKSRLTGKRKAGGSVDVEIYWQNHSVFMATTDRRRNTLMKTSSHAMATRSAAAVPIPLKHCVTNFNKTSGVTQALVDKKEYTPFRTYSLRIWHVATVFQGQTKGWNKNYGAAQKIYGKSPLSKSVRTGLRIKNYMSYSNDYTNTHSQVHEISGMECLLKMLDSYDPPSNSSPRYTYVIMPDSHVYFSITSKSIATDFLSKHALHAGAAREVVYSGEFFFDRYSPQAEERGTTALVIDNNSGTFGPPKDKLHLLKLLMQLNFGMDMPIFALDREDPLLKELSDANGVE